MAGAGGHEVERIAVKVVPDTGNFRAKLVKELEEAEAGVKVEIPVELKGLADAKAKLEALAKDVTIKLKVELENIVQVRQQLARLARDRVVKLHIDVDTTFFDARMGLLARNRTLQINADLDLQKARIELAVFLRPRTLKINVDYDHDNFRTLRMFMAQISLLARGAANSFQTMGQVGNFAFRQASQGASSFGRMIRPIYLIALPLLVAAIYLLIGAVAGLVIVLGAVIGGLVLMIAPIAAIGAGIFYIMQSSDKHAKKLRERFKGLGKTAQGVLNTAIRPMTKAISRQIPHLRTYIKLAEGPLRRAFKAGSQYVDEMASALMMFGANTLQGLTKALENPKMQDAVDGFKQLIDDLGTAIGRTFETLAEGGADYGAMFEALGDALIKLLPSLARMLNAFASVSPGLIDKLAAGLDEIFGILSNPTVLAALEKLASFSWGAIVGSLQAIALQIVITVNFFYFLWESAKWIFNAVVAIVRNEFNRVKRIFADAKTYVSQKASEIKQSVVNQFNGMVGFVRGLLNGFTGWFGSLWNRITGQSRRGAMNTRTAAIGPFNGMASSISGIMDRIVGIISNAWSRISGIASKISGIIGGIAAKAGSIGGILDKIPFFLSGPEVEQESIVTKVFKGVSPPPGDDGAPTFGAPTLFRSFDDLSSAHSSLSRAQARIDRANGPSEVSTGVPARVFNFTTYAAPNEPTEKQFVKWLDYADTLYAT